MISFDQAYQLVMDAAALLGAERVPLAEAQNRVLAQDVLADTDVPPFNKAAMDGYACRKADLGQVLRIVEEIPAGHVSRRTIGPGECAGIMTGAPVPRGADCVVMQEDTELVVPGAIRVTVAATETNICPQGEDIRCGATVLSAGEMITPAHIAVLATVGCDRPLVARKPRVGVLATGDELVEPGEKTPGARIRNSNSYQLCAQVESAGGLARNYGLVPDTLEAIGTTIRNAAAESDLLLVSGGVSVGAYDLVPQAFAQNGFQFLFRSVAMQPGRPTLFGSSGRVFCCGLPGNPVSAFVVFELLLRPFVLKLMGHTCRPRLIVARLGQTVSRRKTGRRATIPVRFSESGTVLPVEYHGSAHIHAFCQADALLTIPEGEREIKEGTPVYVRPL